MPSRRVRASSDLRRSTSGLDDSILELWVIGRGLWPWTTHYELPEAWETIDPPSESRFEDWHLNAMHQLSGFLGDWKHVEPFGYLGLGDKAEKLISD